MTKRVLGTSGIEVSALGMGCWAIGGPLYHGDTPLGWGETDDGESLRALEVAFDMGVTFFDTADVYGAGHSETLVGRAFRGRRERVVIATKFGNRFEERTRQLAGEGADGEFIIAQCEGSLRRLGTDYIDLYQFHINGYPAERIDAVTEVLERLVEQGKVRGYGWSTDSPDSAGAMKGEHYCAVQFQQNVLDPNVDMNALTAARKLAAINRGPLAMGLLSGKYEASTKVGVDDVRGARAPEWMMYFREGRPREEYIAKLESIRGVLTGEGESVGKGESAGEGQGEGRSVAQGTLAWSLSVAENIIPIPGIRTAEQARENFDPKSWAAPLARKDSDPDSWVAPLARERLAEIERLRQEWRAD